MIVLLHLIYIVLVGSVSLLVLEDEYITIKNGLADKESVILTIAIVFFSIIILTNSFIYIGGLLL